MAVLRFLLLLTTIALMVREGKSLKCWSCNSNSMDGKGCADPFRGSTDIKDDLRMFTRNCSSIFNFAVKLYPGATSESDTEIHDSRLVFVCAKFTGTILGAPVVLRGCALGLPDITERSCMYMNPQNHIGGNILTCDACSGDLCNGAAIVETAAVLFVGTLLLLSA